MNKQKNFVSNYHPSAHFTNKENRDSHDFYEVAKRKLEIVFKGWGLKEDKIEKLLHYFGKPLTLFNQFDVFTEVEPGDPVVRPDKDGDCIFGGSTDELMSGGPAIRVLVLPGTTPEVIQRGLKKIMSWIKKEPNLLTDYLGNPRK